MPSKVEEELKAWLEKGGRPLEMKVAATFEKSADTARQDSFHPPIWRLKVEQSPFFQDPDEDKAREIDVVALFWNPAAEQCVVSVAVECKFDAPPFIVLLPSAFEPYQFRCFSNGVRRLMPGTTYQRIPWLGGTALFDATVPVGHSILTKTSDRRDAPGRERKDVGWAAAISAGKAADWYATRRDSENHAAFSSCSDGWSPRHRAASRAGHRSAPRRPRSMRLEMAAHLWSGDRRRHRAG